MKRALLFIVFLFLTAKPSVAQVTHLIFFNQPHVFTDGGYAFPYNHGMLFDHFIVEELDSSNNLVGGASDPITLTIGPGSPAGTLVGTSSGNASGGVFIISSAQLGINKPGTGYTLVASTTTPGISSATSASFTIYDQTSGNQCTGTLTCSVVFPVAPVNGNIVVVNVSTYADDRTITITDSGSSSYTNAACASFPFVDMLTPPPIPFDQRQIHDIYRHQMSVNYTLALAGAAANFTVTAAVTGSPVSNHDTSGPLIINMVATIHSATSMTLDQCTKQEAYPGGGAAATTITSGVTSTRTASNEWLIGNCRSLLDTLYYVVPNSPFSDLATENGYRVAQQNGLVTSTGTDASTMTSSPPAWVNPSGHALYYRCSIMTFK